MKTKAKVVKAKAAIKKVVSKAKRRLDPGHNWPKKKLGKVVKVEKPAPAPSPDVNVVAPSLSPNYVPPMRFAPTEPPSAEVLDALAALARRCDLFLKEGIHADTEARLRARLDTLGLREWVAERLIT
jgi:hypothetical protein